VKPWHYLAAAAVVLLLARRKKAPDMIITEEEVAQWERDHGEWQGPPLPDGFNPDGTPIVIN